MCGALGKLITEQPDVEGWLEKGTFKILVFDRCAFGHRCGEEGSNRFISQKVSIITNVEEIKDVCRNCPGANPSHLHSNQKECETASEVRKFREALCHLPYAFWKSCGKAMARNLLNRVGLSR